jgi:regulatory protein
MQKAKTYTVEQAKRRLEQYCVYQDRSHYEVIKKLREMKMIPMAIDAIILHLMQHNFLNEERFARSYVRGKFNIKKYGRIKIVQGLKQKNITANLIKIALKEIEEGVYLETLTQLAEKKIQVLKEPNKYKKKQKLIRFLMQKGYESHLIYELVNNLEL